MANSLPSLMPRMPTCRGVVRCGCVCTCDLFHVGRLPWNHLCLVASSAGALVRAAGNIFGWVMWREHTLASVA